MNDRNFDASSRLHHIRSDLKLCRGESSIELGINRNPIYTDVIILNTPIYSRECKMAAFNYVQ
jgi:hypothetical protein